jgi:hypothetical protein
VLVLHKKKYIFQNQEHPERKCTASQKRVSFSNTSAKNMNAARFACDERSLISVMGYFFEQPCE